MFYLFVENCDVVRLRIDFDIKPRTLELSLFNNLTEVWARGLPNEIDAPSSSSGRGRERKTGETGETGDGRVMIREMNEIYRPGEREEYRHFHVGPNAKFASATPSIGAIRPPSIPGSKYDGVQEASADVMVARTLRKVLSPPACALLCVAGWNLSMYQFQRTSSYESGSKAGCGKQ